MASSIVKHVASGNWLGASWTSYAIPKRYQDQPRESVSKAFELACLRAARKGWDLESTSRNNFEYQAKPYLDYNV
jgi:hypothetical protein